MINTLSEINKKALECPKQFIKDCDKEYLDNIVKIAKHIENDDDLENIRSTKEYKKLTDKYKL